ncbi:hypothetical protein GN958_ATG04507 [Phytophthora infestans]|uniref:Uncharacterized protein n=1 Tax=Phytophthora infestans TaxID=4787 RepID=A0A8S9V0G3_PHYIN|nr:hypothetical protein GN958_ATG04507 [Phytophthora infestans]
MGAGASEAAAEVGVLRGSQRSRRPDPMPALLQVATAGYIVARARRRIRNRAGRYTLEHQAEYVTPPGRPSGPRWLSHEGFEGLDDAGKIEDALGAGIGV